MQSIRHTSPHHPQNHRFHTHVTKQSVTLAHAGPYIDSLGGSGHSGGAALGSLGGTSLFPCTRSALTKTGITPPVSSANFYSQVSKHKSPHSRPLNPILTLCPIASRILPMAPEWLVSERNTFASVEKMSSRNVASRYRRAVSGSR